MEDDNNSLGVQPLIHTFSSHHPQAVNGCIVSTASVCERSFHSSGQSYFILIPSEDQDGNHRELLQKVYVYPQGSISTVFEKSQHQNILKEKDDQVLKAIDSVRKDKFFIKKKGSIFGSSNSIASGRQSVDSNKIVLNSGSPYFNMPSLSPNRPRLNNFSQNFNYLNTSNKYLYNDNISDNFSLLSNASDLSFYNEEYAAIKKEVSDIPFTHVDRKAVYFHSENKASQTDIKFKEQDFLINSLQFSKEELDIQIRRLSSQLQKTIREKETSAEQFEIIQTKISETGRKEYFQVLKDKVALEGQYEALKHEHENCCIDKTLLQVKIFEIQAKLFEKDKEIEHLKKMRDGSENLISELENKYSDKANEFTVLLGKYEKIKDVICKLECELETKKSDFVQNGIKLSNADLEIVSLKQSNEKLHELIKVCKSKRDFYNEERKNLESKISESYLQVVSMKDSQESLQTEFNKVHNYNTDHQKQLTEARVSITVISADRDRIKAEMERLNFLLQENKTKEIREKSSLIIQLDEFEADMKEREAAVAKYDGKALHITVNKERYQKLEDVFDRFQKLKIKMGELQRENESINGEINHKKMLQIKNETFIRDLRKDLVITQEKVSEKELSVSSLNSQLQEAKLKLKNSLSITVEKENLLSKLKEDKMELDALLKTANEDKKLVDTSLSKLKEDMNKLTANHFRMKHDIVAKDRQIELLQEENSNFSCLNLELAENLKSDKEVHDLKERNKILEEEVKSLKDGLQNAENKDNAASDKINSLKNTLEQIICERKNSDCELKLCNEQIISLQLTNKTYADKLMLKNHEISLNNDRILDMESDSEDLKKKISHLYEKIAVFQQEEEGFSETQDHLQKSIEDLRVNLKIEISAKNSLEARHKIVQEEFLLQKMKYLNQVDNLEKTLTSLKNKLYECKQPSENNGNMPGSIFKMKFRVPEHLDVILFTSLGQNFTNENFPLEQYVLAMKTGLSASKDETGALQRHNEIICKKPSYKSKNSNISNFFISNTQTVEHRPLRKHKLKFRNGSKLRYKNRLTFYNKNFDDGISYCNFHLWPVRISLEIKSNKIISLSSQISELSEEINNLKSDNGNLSGSIESKNECISLLQKELNDCKDNMLLISNECKDWKLKYEGLSDFIPQKDTDNIKQVVALHHSQFQIFNDRILSATRDSVSHEKSDISKCYSSSNDDRKITKSQSLNIIFNDEVCKSALHHSGKQNFEENDSSFTSPTMIDQQIIKSNHNLHPSSADLCQGNLDWCALQQSNDEKNYSITLEKETSGNIASVTSRDPSMLMQPEIGDRPIIAELERKLAAREDEIMELHNEASKKIRHIHEVRCKLEQKEFEFQNKRRQYISNIRLLTRKLKEHMNGRRECEKDLEAMMQESKQKLVCEEKRFNLLKEKNMATEALCQQLNSEKIDYDISNNGLRKELDDIKMSLNTQQSINIDLQRNVGYLEVLKMCLNSSKSRELLLETEIKQLKDLYMNIQEKLEKVETEKLAISRQCTEFCLNNDLLNRNIKNLDEEILKNAKQNELLELDVADKLLEVSNLKEELVTMKEQLANSNAFIRSIEVSEGLLKSENESLKEEIEVLNANLLQKQISFEESVVINTNLKEEHKLREDIILVFKQELESMQFQYHQANQDHSEALAIMNAKIVNATEIENSLNEKLKSIHEQKLYYQNLTAEFRTSLNCALSHIRSLKGPIASMTTPVLPSPSPLNTESLLKLIEKCSAPPSSVKCLSVFTKRLSALRGEVASVQQEFHIDQEKI